MEGIGLERQWFGNEIDDSNGLKNFCTLVCEGKKTRVVLTKL